MKQMILVNLISFIKSSLFVFILNINCYIREKKFCKLVDHLYILLSKGKLLQTIKICQRYLMCASIIEKYVCLKSAILFSIRMKGNTGLYFNVSIRL